MKKYLIKIIGFGVLLIQLLSSCTNQKESNETDKNIADGSNKELWAEQVQSSTDLTKPDGWSDEDWKSVSKGIDQKKIFDAITEAVYNGKLQAYDYITDAPISIDKVKLLFEAKIDTIIVVEGEKETSTPMKTQLGAESITQLRTREKWFFDKDRLKLEKQVSSVALFTNFYTETGNLIGQKALFYVKL